MAFRSRTGCTSDNDARVYSSGPGGKCRSQPRSNSWATTTADRASSRGEFHPPALSEPDVTVSRHPAPTGRPRSGGASCQWANRAGWWWCTRTSQSNRSGVTSPESLELLHGPSDQVVVDAPCQEAQLGAVEDSVVVDPATTTFGLMSADRLDRSAQLRRFRCQALIFWPIAFLALVLMAGTNPMKCPYGPLSQAAPEGEPEEVEADMLRGLRAGSSPCRTRSWSCRGAARGQGSRAAGRSRARSSSAWVWVSQWITMSSA